MNYVVDEEGSHGICVTTPIDVSSSNSCMNWLYQCSCPCGLNRCWETQDRGECQWKLTKEKDNVQTYTCTKCGAKWTRTTVTTEKDSQCRYYLERTDVFTEKNGKAIPLVGNRPMAIAILKNACAQMVVVNPKITKLLKVVLATRASIIPR